MYSVMIVDKRKQMYTIYRDMIPWQQYQFEIISYCDSESQAMEHFCEHRHDLVITDIRLRSGDGISLLRQLKACSPDCHVIVCSNDSDMQTVRSAWRSGCMDYLERGMFSGAQLIENLKMIRESHDAQARREDWRDELEHLLGLIRKGESAEAEKLMPLLQRDELSCLQGKYRMICFRMDNVRRTYANGLFNDRRHLRRELGRVVDSVMQVYGSFTVLFSTAHSGTIIIRKQDEEMALECARTLSEQFRKCLPLTVSLSISPICEGCQDFIDLYNGYAKHHHDRFYCGDGCVMKRDEMQFCSLDFGSIRYKETLVKLAEVSDFAHCRELIVTMLTEMKERQIEPTDVVYYCRSIVHAKDQQLLARTGGRHSLMTGRTQLMFERAETVRQLQDDLIEVMKDAEAWAGTCAQGTYSKTVLDIMQYVDAHLGEKITLEQIANTVQRTPIHISRIFKKQTGENLMQYINRKKMDHAAKLMELSHLKIKDIAEAVGMKDQLYFNKVFRRFYQESPRTYRSKL